MIQMQLRLSLQQQLLRHKTLHHHITLSLVNFDFCNAVRYKVLIHGRFKWSKRGAFQLVALLKRDACSFWIYHLSHNFPYIFMSNEEENHEMLDRYYHHKY